MNVIKRNGDKQKLDITKIQDMTSAATYGLEGVSQSELEVDAKIKFIDDMKSSDIQDILIKTAVEKIDIDVPNWTFVGARLFIFDLYHRVGRNTKGVKGEIYKHLSKHIEYAVSQNKMFPNIADGFDLNDLNNYIDIKRDYLFNYLGIKTLYDRYLLKDNKGEPIELPQHMFMCIAMFLAQNEIDKQTKAKEFYDVISKFEVMLATPTLSNARTNRHQLSSCYIGSTPDNIEGIFDSYKEMALLSKYGGGLGWDWNMVRALGGSIDNNVGAAGGTIPFLKITNDIAIAVDQLGTRKGAIATYIEPWHMDIDDFVDIKKNSGEERRRAHDIFPALWISDIFMERVKNNDKWTLFDPYDVPMLSELYGEEFNKKYFELENDVNVKKTVILAKDLWKKILTSYFEVGSPFLCWKDTANKANPNNHFGVIRSSNLCTEIFQNTSPNTYYIKLHVAEGKSYLLFKEDDVVILKNGKTKLAKNVTSLDTLEIGEYSTYNNVNEYDQPYYVDLIHEKDCKVWATNKYKVDGDTAVCNLASVNLSKVNTKEDMERVVPIAIRMLDNVIDLNYYPLVKVKNTCLKTRAIGLGVMGEAQMLAESKIHFGSNEHLEKIDSIMECFSYNVIKASSHLGREKGNYKTFDGSKWSKGILPVDTINDKVRKLVNGSKVYSDSEWQVLREVASKNMRNGYLMAIAPTSSISILVGTTQAIEPVYKRKWYEENLSGLIPVTAPNLNPDTWEYYSPAHEVDQFNLIRAAAIRQKWIDQGQSTNIFASLDLASGRYLNDLYMLAWELGLKSTYYLRSQSKEASKAEEPINNVVDRKMECAGCQ